MKNANILQEFTVGSKLFGLDTDSSDTDKVVVYLDYESRLFPNAKLNFVEVDESTNSEISYVELGEFIKAVLLRPSLKDIELLYAVSRETDSDYVSDDMFFLFNMIHDALYAPKVTDMYIREINRRYNKLWFRDHNVTGKNFNQEVELDTKYAAHLFRVLHSAKYYLRTHHTPIKFGHIREDYLKIKEGHFKKDEIKSIVDTLKDAVMLELNSIAQPSDELDKRIEDKAKALYWYQVKVKYGKN